MRVGVVTFPGSNCDYDLYKAAQQIGAKVEFIWHRQKNLDGYDALMLPGGFSYGDYPVSYTHLRAHETLR